MCIFHKSLNYKYFKNPKEKIKYLFYFSSILGDIAKSYLKFVKLNKHTFQFICICVKIPNREKGSQ